MSIEFFSSRTVKARKPHRCEECRKEIPMGVSHVYCAGKYDGDFSTYREHVECREAWVALNYTLRGGPDYDGALFLCDDEIEPEERDWLAENHPVVAARMGFATEQSDA